MMSPTPPTIRSLAQAATSSSTRSCADRRSGTLATAPGQINPYKLGIELFRDIEERWNQGRFGKEWEEEDDYEKRVTWDTGAGIGRKKIFEVRKIYNDVTFLDTFLTEEFCEAQKLYVYGVNQRTGQREIVSRDWLLVKDQLLNAFTNRGQPVIEILDGNHRNRGELYLIHRYDGKDLRVDFAQETLKSLFVVWKRPVHVETVVDGQGQLISFDGERVGGIERARHRMDRFSLTMPRTLPIRLRYGLKTWMVSGESRVSTTDY